MVVQAPRLNAVGFILAGGRSRRMGRDKALLPWGAATLIDHALALLRDVCTEVRILSGPEPRYGDRGAPVDVDVVAQAGALGGVYTGLLRLGDAPGLFMAVDIPRVPAALLRRLLELATGYDAVVPVSPGGPEPLCAVYTRACIEPIRRRLETGELKMTGFWPDVRVREVGPVELTAFGDPAAIFLNVNTPEDYGPATGP